MRATGDAIRTQVEHLRDTLAAHERVTVGEGIDMPVVDVPAALLLDAMRALREGPGGYAYCSMITAIDHLSAGREPRFDVVYALYSIPNNRWVRVRTTCAEFDAEVPSVSGIWPGANWLERECYDMFGIQFTGHPDLRRILMPEGYEHHPLRKEFPRDGIEPDRLYREWESTRVHPAAEESR